MIRALFAAAAVCLFAAPAQAQNAAQVDRVQNRQAS